MAQTLVLEKTERYEKKGAGSKRKNIFHKELLHWYVVFLSFFLSFCCSFFVFTVPKGLIGMAFSKVI